MRIATWNINGIRARSEFVELWLRDRQPDVVGFQELKAPDESFPHEIFDNLGYHVVTHGQKSWNGVAVISRSPMEVTQTGLPGQDENGSRLLSVSVEGMNFTSVYCPNGKDLDHPDFAMKLGWFDSLIDHWSAHHDKTGSHVLCGDFNIAPTALDSWYGEKGDGAIFHTEEERQRLASLLDTGLTDVFRQHHPSEQAFSWWDYRRMAFPQNHGLRLDFLLATRPLAERTREVMIDRDYRKKKNGITASDHAPVYADID